MSNHTFITFGNSRECSFSTPKIIFELHITSYLGYTFSWSSCCIPKVKVVALFKLWLNRISFGHTSSSIIIKSIFANHTSRWSWSISTISTNISTSTTRTDLSIRTTSIGGSGIKIIESISGWNTLSTIVFIKISMTTGHIDVQIEITTILCELI